MASPLVVVTEAMVTGVNAQGLQSHLFLAFAASCTLGVAYGYRQSLKSVVAASSCGLVVQCVSLAACYHLSAWPRRSITWFLQRAFKVERVALVEALNWLMYITLVVSGLALVFGIAVRVPVSSFLAPLYTASCLFPYAATFMSMKNDVLSYRAWQSLSPGPKKDRGPPGIDLRTLTVMQINNTLWASFGVLVNDPVSSHRV